MIDWNRITNLIDEIGAEDFDEVVELFIEEVDEVIARLHSTADIVTLEADMHLLKGCALNLGFSTFAQKCQNGETMAASGKSEDVDIIDVLECYSASKKSFVDGLPAALAA
ncbi:histidine kinase [Sulfitobacter sp. SK012]|uniref:Hpt domain-containing protein n=1 Tax=Sulfitobacter sp. SK012 TaxID=1389005 RepID=UPI000E0A4F14|nr:Hpt domain-containing protein [Sulfitobacter sp. SK012]AXI44638.1 histidine kinase [Sulfitobacter sp. SK012]